jgi:hypothetical protein
VMVFLLGLISCKDNITSFEKADLEKRIDGTHGVITGLWSPNYSNEYFLIEQRHNKLEGFADFANEEWDLLGTFDEENNIAHIKLVNDTKVHHLKLNLEQAWVFGNYTAILSGDGVEFIFRGEL